MTDKANYFHYCGKFVLELLISRVDNIVFGNTQNVPY